jgi:hypothetical protein
MQKIKNIVHQSLKLGFLEESESIMSDLVDAQCQEMGLLHDETLDSIQLWSETLALLERWDHLAEIQELLEAAEAKIDHENLSHTIRQISKLRSFERQTS